MKPPTQVGKYRINRQLGQGGMGTVYLAHDTKIGRLVALKFLRVDNDDTRKRFEREAQSAGRLKHPNIVTLFDYAEESETPYLVMEFVEGRTISEALRVGLTISIRHRLGLMIDVLLALHYAHTSSVVHRDIKPSNLMLTPDGGIKILDFGIARHTDTRSSRSSRIVGTAAYMAPEQIRSEPVDGRCDIFSFGAVCQEFLTGQQVFDGETDYAVMERILRGEPAPFDHPNRALTRLMRPVIARALEKSPADRYSDAAAFAAAILEVVDQLDKTGGADEFTDSSTIAIVQSKKDETTGVLARVSLEGPPADDQPPAGLRSEPAPRADGLVKAAQGPRTDDRRQSQAIVPPPSEEVPMPAMIQPVPLDLPVLLPVIAIDPPVDVSHQVAVARIAPEPEIKRILKRKPRKPPTPVRVAASVELREFMAGTVEMVPSTARPLISASATLHVVVAAIVGAVLIANTDLPATREITRIFMPPPALSPPPPPPPPKIAMKTSPPQPSRPTEVPFSAPEPVTTPIDTAAPTEAPNVIVPEPPPAPPAPPVDAVPVPIADTSARAEVFGADPVDRVDRPPQLIEDVVPAFPAEALRNKMKSAAVVVQVVVERDGSVSRPQIIKGVDLLNEAAIDAAMKYRFRPARLRGQTVAYRWTITIVFDFK